MYVFYYYMWDDMECTLKVLPLHHWSMILNKSMYGPQVMLQTKHSCPETLFAPGRQAHKLSSSLKTGRHFLRTQYGKPISSRQTMANVSRQWSHFHMQVKFILLRAKSCAFHYNIHLTFFFFLMWSLSYSNSGNPYDHDICDTCFYLVYGSSSDKCFSNNQCILIEKSHSN